MISITKSPNVCSLTKNSMIFEVESSQLYPEPKVYPKLILTFDENVLKGFYFQFNFINPDNLNIETIRFRSVDGVGYDFNEYQQEGDFPVQNYALSLADFTLDFIKWLKKIKTLTSYYNVISDTDGEIQLVAKQPIEELIPTGIEENFSERNPVDFDFDYSIYSLFNEPIERVGYKLKALLYYNDPKNDLSDVSNYELINSQVVQLDENSKGYIDIAELINGKIEADLEEVPVPPYNTELNTAWYWFTPNLRKYYVKFIEIWDGKSSENIVESSVLSAHWGGISTDDEIVNDTINHVLTANKFMTWIPSGKDINKGQIDFLHFMNGHQKKNWKVKLKMFSNLRTTTYELGEIELDEFQTVGFFANIEKYIDNPDTTNTIGIVPGEIINKYEIQIFEFELGVGYPTEPTDSYLYYYRDYCEKKYVLYFNSFSLPETFSTNSDWDEKMASSKEIAYRGLQYNNSILRSKNFIFSYQHQNSIGVTSSLMKREVIKRLQSLLSSTYTFILEENKWVPVIIQTDKANVWNQSEYVQVLDFEMIKANSSDKPSFYTSLPTLLIEKDSFSLNFNMLLNGFKLKTAGDLKIYDQFGTLKKTLTFDTVNMRYRNTAATSYWHTALLEENKYNYITLLTDSNDEQHTIKGVFEHKLKRASFLLEGTGNKSFTFVIDTSGPYAVENRLFLNRDHQTGNWETISMNPSEVVTTNYVFSGDHLVQLAAPDFRMVYNFYCIGAGIKNINIEQFTELKLLTIGDSGTIETLYLNKLKKLTNVTIQNSDISKIDIGFPENMITFRLENLTMDALGIQNVIEQFWKFRKGFENAITIQLVSMATINSITTEIINGTGDYASDGLVDNNFTVTIS